MKRNVIAAVCALTGLSGCVGVQPVETATSAAEAPRKPLSVPAAVGPSGIRFADDAVGSSTNVVFAVGAGEVKTISGGKFYMRPTMSGFEKDGEGALVVDSPVQVTGLGDVRAGTLKVARLFSEGGSSADDMLAPMPAFSKLRFAPGARLDLSNNVGFLLNGLVGGPAVVNAGVFGIGGKWTLTGPDEVLSVDGEGVSFYGETYAGQLGFAEGAEFDFKDAAAEEAYSKAALSAGPAGVVVARARRVYAEGDLLDNVALVMPKLSAATSRRWAMRASDDRRTIRLFLADASAGDGN